MHEHHRTPHALARRVRNVLAVAGISTVALSSLGASPAQASEHPGARAGDGSPCTRGLPVGTSTLDVAFEGETYAVRVQVPDAPVRRSLPLVLDLHGSNNNATTQADISDLESLADAEGFIVATPTGDIAFPHTLPDGNWAWNVPGVPLTSGTYPPADSREDVGFLTAVVDELDSAGCIDARRVYATGFSGGGRMASALACEASDVFAAIAPVAGLRAGRPDAADLTVPEAGTCDPEHPVSVVTFHGTDDFVNPYPGNADPRWGYTVQTAASTWASLNECRVGPRISSVSESVVAYSWTECVGHADVVLYEVTGGGHTWPDTDVPLDEFGLGAVTHEINASSLMWDFFESHPRRG